MDEPSALRQVTRIAHGYGNRRDRIAKAIEANVDLIEADLRFWRGSIVVRHEHRLPILPLLSNYGLDKGIHRQGPWAVRAGKVFLRLDVAPIGFRELLQLTSGRAGLLLDLKAASYSEAVAEAFVDRVLTTLDEHGFAGAVEFCGSWPLLELVRKRRPDFATHFSVDEIVDWNRLVPRLRGANPVRAISLRYTLIDASRMTVLREHGVDCYAWDVKSLEAATRAVEAGVSGILADDLDMLRELRGTPVRMRGRQQ